MDRTLLVTLRFDGRAFCGWQVQQNAPTAMAAFQEALWKVLGHQTDIKGCSRTDSGVHALRYYVSFQTGNPIGCDRLPAALNTALPRSMAALCCREVPEGFHARYSARGKRYVYRILRAPVRDPFWEGLALHRSRPLDLVLLGAQAEDFLGTHDFSAFCAAGSTVQDRVRTITACRFAQREELIELTVEGDGFLYHMVRIMAGTLLDIADGKLPPGCIPDILASRDRARAGRTAPACGLYLDEVFYNL